MSYPNTVKIIEVGPRDGLQNESSLISAKDKAALIDQLVDAGVKHIDAGSFVSPKWVPNMANSADVFELINRKNDVVYSCLTPNMKGFESALKAQVNEVAIFGAASEAFTQKNINCSIAESIARFEPVVKAAKQNNIKMRGYVSCVLGCPYEGEIAVSKVVEVSEMLWQLGCDEISLGDTIGVGTPLKTKVMINAVRDAIPIGKIAVHFHDTYGQALANILMALELGITTIDASVAGLGGCPYAKGASGNVATEDVVYMLQGMRIETGINLEKLVKAGNFIVNKLSKENSSKVAKAILAKNSI